MRKREGKREWNFCLLFFYVFFLGKVVRECFHFNCYEEKGRAKGKKFLFYVFLFGSSLTGMGFNSRQRGVLDGCHVYIYIYIYRNGNLLFT